MVGYPFDEVDGENHLLVPIFAVRVYLCGHPKPHSMQEFAAWTPESYEAVVSILLTAACFGIYWFLAISEPIKARFFANHPTEKAWIRFVFYQKMMGVLWLGIVPGIIVLTTTDFTLTTLGLNLQGLGESATYIGIMGVLILVMNFFSTRKAEHQAYYPQMRVAVWTPKVLFINGFAWFAYLFAYEFLFRGILLFLCYPLLGFWPSVAINLALYSTTHIPKGAGETFGTFLYGLILCYVTISTGSFLVAFVTHLIMALSNDLFSIYHSKTMRVGR